MANTGKCLCGNVSLTVENVISEALACHCQSCRRWASGAFIPFNAGSSIALDGIDSVKVHQSSEHGERAFCSNCGSSLYFFYKPERIYMVSTGLFEDTSHFKLTKQIFTEEKPSFYELS